ncbi:MAG: hypothetical protein R2794_11725 [Chitinophagales bacterium]
MDLIFHLLEVFSTETLIIRDYWEADRCAIGLASVQSEKLMYISTYRKEKGLFYVEIDFKEPNTEKSKDVLRYDDVPMPFVEQMLVEHLGVFPDTHHLK